MTTTAGAPQQPLRGAPWHLWVVGLLSLLWNAYGAYDYTLSHAQGDAYYRQVGMTPQQIASMHAMPVWTEFPWALGVWGAVFGSVLLLARSRWAYASFLVSLIAAMISMAYAALVGEAGGSQAMLSIVIIVAAALFAVYAWAMQRRGVLARR